VVSALRERNQPVEHIVAEDEGHSIALRENKIQIMALSTRFLLEQLTASN
jgi:dipeptidyl aminopeptidase/acylaminoacyl peptidase